MTYIVDGGFIKCKYMDCVEVCPVDCFYEGENMLVVHRTMHRLRCLRTRVPRRRNQAGYRAPNRKVARDQHPICSGVAKRHRKT